MSSSSSTRSTSKRIAVLLLAVAGQPAAAVDLNPLLAGFDLPAALPAISEHSFELRSAVGNISLDQTAGNEHVQLDAEVSRSELIYTRPVSHALNLQVTAPWIAVRGGMLDSFIERWHRTFNLPNGNRAEWPQNRLLIAHQKNGQTDLLISKPARGFGDLSLRAGWQLSDADQGSAMLWLSVKLPTGSADNLTGSETTDVSLSLSASQRPFSRIGTYEQLSTTYLSNGSRLSPQQRNHAFSAMVGAEWLFSGAWKFDAQFSAHSAIYDSALRVLGNSLQLHFGPVYERGNWRTRLLISEDLAVDTAPDVQFTLSVTRRL